MNTNEYVKKSVFYRFTVIILICAAVCAAVLFTVTEIRRERLAGSVGKKLAAVISLPMFSDAALCNAGEGSVMFIIAEHNGIIGIFSPDKNTLYSTLDVRVETLPETDRGYLSSGIVVSNQNELLSVIEDYTS